MLRGKTVLTTTALLAVCAGTASANQYQDLRSPDARDAARDLPRVVMSPPVVEVREAPSGGFDWGDAGIGAAGTIGLFSIAGGAALLVTSRRRRSVLRAATH
jgi:hypothetical protein